MELSTKQEVANFIKSATKEACSGNWDMLNAQVVAEKLKISRNLASQYLNQLVHEKVLMKINSRPVCFLHITVFEELTGLGIRRETFDDMDEFRAFIKSRYNNFQSLIGFDGSLSDCIEQIKIAAYYPPNGLPMMLIGKKGTGKSLLCSLAFQYMKSAELLPGDAVYARVSFHTNSARNEAVIKKVFTDKDSAVRKNKAGLLVLEKFHRLDKPLQTRVLDLLDSLNGEKCSMWKVLLTSEPTENEEINNFWRNRIPVTAICPELKQRSRQEKERMILHFFAREENAIHKKIRISQKVFAHLVDFRFDNHIEGLQSEIKKLCARAYLYQKGEEALSIHSYYFSEELLAELAVNKELDESSWVFPCQREQGGEQKVYGLDEEIYESFLKAETGAEGFEPVIDSLYRYLQKQMKHHAYKLVDEEEPKKNSAQVIYDDLISLVENRFHCVLPKGFAGMMFTMIKKQMQGMEERESRLQEAEALKERLCQRFKAEAKVADYLLGLIEINLGIRPDDVTAILLVAGLKYYNQQLNDGQMGAVIICHGVSTASSMADAVNELLGCHIFEAIDMPLDTELEKIADILKDYVQRSCMSNRILILVDMGGLELIDEKLKKAADVELGIMNRVSTDLAVRVGSMIMEGLEIPEILREVSGNSGSRCRLIQRKEKRQDKAILFIGEKGTDIALKMKELFWGSFPKEIQVKALYWNYGQPESLPEYIRKSEYEILFSIGVDQYESEEIPHMDISEIITLDQYPKVYQALKAYFTDEEIQVLLNNLLKSFSMQNIIQHLTILNPVALTDRIEVSLDLLQHYLNIKFQPGMIMSLYVHLSFLIERLVTKNPIESHRDLESFEKEHGTFIAMVGKSFKNIEDHYHVEIPLSEMAYIYEFIQHNDEPS